jgi:hypothetical protein
MASRTDSPVAAGSGGEPSAAAVIAAVNGTLAAVGGVYSSTRSVLITVIAAIAAITLAVIVLVPHR